MPLDVPTIGQGVTLLSGDARDVLPTLASNSVHCVVTSPPYYGLRDYGCAGQIGLEATPDEYLATMVAVFREMKRVLRPDGTLWLNIGDSYASAPVGSFNGGGFKDKSAQTGGRDMSGVATSGIIDKVKASGLKPKDLLLMPARLALALQADGWWVRSDIIWAKPNPMPESVTDRPTSAYEHVFLLTKSARYFYDGESIRQPVSPNNDGRGVNVPLCDGYTGERAKNGPTQATRTYDVIKGAACRNVWTIATHAFSESHFATMPPALAERCIRAGTSERGCCAACGAPWRREVERSVVWDRRTGTNSNADRNDGGMSCNADRSTTTTGWAASCACAADVVPATVLDVFAGAGTTLLVADRLQRNAIGIELNVAYTTMAMDRCRSDAPLFSSYPPAEDPADARVAADARQRDMFDQC